MFADDTLKTNRMYKAETIYCGTVGFLIRVQSIGMRSFLDLQLISVSMPPGLSSRYRALIFLNCAVNDGHSLGPEKLHMQLHRPNFAYTIPFQ